MKKIFKDFIEEVYESAVNDVEHCEVHDETHQTWLKLKMKRIEEICQTYNKSARRDVIQTIKNLNKLFAEEEKDLNKKYDQCHKDKIQLAEMVKFEQHKLASMIEQNNKLQEEMDKIFCFTFY